jgi:fumarate reductase subunit D
MKHLLLRLEPVIWLLFGLGIMVGTMLMTAWIAVVGLGAPMGLIPADALAFERAHALGSTLIGRVVLAALIALPLWKGAHHTRHISIDMGNADRDGLVAPLLYLIAIAGSVLGIAAVVRL